ncbi:hypothetical protein CDL15_Pgr025451 [Punica granatum]|uniref:F-box domain-containing protein n=1 Tax=Punica granatum TaxID=22663 RepID=A0A218W8R9_PUNGR|nr:hypothetical protein CDL15_Pgr025451 [Punica granatum]
MDRIVEQRQQPSNAQRGFRVQAPLVDSVSCYCKVDSGLKTVVGARKFVPGSKLCIQPDINPNAHRTKNSRRERTRVQPPLIPGLPDDLAIGCLIRVPRVEHRKLRLVCKRWYRLLTGNYFYSLRKNLGLAEEALEAAALVSLNGKLCIIRNNMSISLVDVSSPDKHVETNPQIWENITGRGHFRTIVTNLWSSIAGRSGSKSHIVHCQVLQA